jgi:Restriction endonuclease
LIPSPEGHNDKPHFHNLSGEEFEKLILDLIREQNPGTTPCRFGPMRQDGFDIQVTLKNGDKVFIECKQRQQSFNGSELKEAVDRFLSGEKAGWAAVFRVITSGTPTSTVKDEKLQAELECESRGINFEFEPRESLWLQLLDHPNVVERHLGPFWGEESRKWCEARLAQNREKNRREEREAIYSAGDVDRYEYGYFVLEFLLPNPRRFQTSAMIQFKTLDRALITLNNDEVLDFSTS